MATRDQIRVAARGIFAVTDGSCEFERSAPIVKSAIEKQAKAALDALRRAGWKLTR